jgi:DNA mismatch endonuclease (patch repair protein)
MGHLTKEQRSYCMSRIRSKDTKPELIFRRYIWALGLRGYRLKKKLPGKPDLYFKHGNVAVFIDGCFWHKCPTCYIAPKSNTSYWDPKIERNQQRDIEVNKTLKRSSIKVLRFWEHDIKKDPDSCYLKLLKTLA